MTTDFLFAESVKPDGKSCYSESSELQKNLHNCYREYHSVKWFFYHSIVKFGWCYKFSLCLSFVIDVHTYTIVK